MNMDAIRRREEFAFSITRDRVQNIKAMNVLMQNNEMQLDIWLQVYPDGASEDDVWEMAENDELYGELQVAFVEAINAFGL